MKRNRQAFTLIEVLAAMAVLAILVLALMRIFGEASRAFQRSTTTVMRNAAARAAMDMLARDLEGMVIDERMACYYEQNTAAIDTFQCDRVSFITTAGEPDDQRSYLAVEYFVTNNWDRSKGAFDTGYEMWVLKRRTCELKALREQGVDPFSVEDKEWWKQRVGVEAAGQYGGEVIAENVVRFDLYICDESGHLIQESCPDCNPASRAYFYPGRNQFYSSSRDICRSEWPEPRISTNSCPAQKAAGLAWPSNRPPAFIDVYLQVASEDGVKKASAMRRVYEQKGWADYIGQIMRLLNRESNILLRRIYPTMRQGEADHPMEYAD